MFYHAENGCLKLDDIELAFVSFGKGEKKLIMIPGLGEGLRTVKGLAVPTALLYRSYASDYQVYVFSRRNQLNEGFTCADMAEDIVKAMELLNIDQASVIGVSQGGMIAQHLAINAPQRVSKLVLAVTYCKPNEASVSVINAWIKMAEEHDYKGIFIDTAEKSYTEKRLKAMRIFYPLLSRIGKPSDFTRYLIQAHACLMHNTEADLHKINCPVLVIGGDQDQIVGSHSSVELAEKIKNSRLILYQGYGHGLYDEVSDFHDQIQAFLKA